MNYWIMTGSITGYDTNKVKKCNMICITVNMNKYEII